MKKYISINHKTQLELHNPDLLVGNVSASSTNSEIGSYHWFHTLMARQKRIGEFLKDKSPTEDILRDWGKQLYENSEELINAYKSINQQ